MHDSDAAVGLYRPRPRRAAGVAAGVSALFLAGTAAGRTYGGGAEPGIATTLLRHANLGAENVLAAWWTAVLLMGVAVAAVLCWANHRQRVPAGRTVAWGWLAVAGASALMSLDELGALHERLELGASRGSWTSLVEDAGLLAVGLAAAAGPTFVFVRALARSGHLASAVLMVAALGWFGVAVLADFEATPVAGSPAYGGTTPRPLAALLLEEGAELAGVLALLAAALHFLTRAARRAGTSEDVPLVRISRRWFRIAGYAVPLILGAGMAGTLLAQQRLLEHRRYDDPIVWFPSMLALGAAAAAVFAARRTAARWRLLPLAGVAAVVAVDVGAAELVSSQLWPGSPRRSFVLGLAVIIAAAGAMLLAWQVQPALRAGLMLWALGVAVGWAATGTLRLVVLFAAHAALLPGLGSAVAAGALRRSGRASPPPPRSGAAALHPAGGPRLP